MVKYSELDTLEKQSIIILMQEGYSSHTIAKRIGRSHSTVSRSIKKFKETGKIENLKRTGRPLISTSRNDLCLKRISIKNRFFSSKDLKKEWEMLSGVIAAPSTVRQRLIDMGLSTRRAKKKPLLTKTNIKNRLKWCRKMKNKTQQFWETVVFSDESNFQLDSNRPLLVRCRPTELFLPECIQKVKKHSPSVMVWGYITYKGVGALHFIDGTVNGKKCRNFERGFFAHDQRNNWP
jgi:transposase